MSRNSELHELLSESRLRVLQRSSQANRWGAPYKPGMSNQHIVCARAARYEYGDDFIVGIHELKRAYVFSRMMKRSALADYVQVRVAAYLYGPDLPGFASQFAEAPNEPRAREARDDASIVVAARIRPLVGGYLCSTVEQSNSAVVTHDGRVHRDGRSLYIIHQRYDLDHVYGPEATTETIHSELVPPLLQNVREGRSATLLLFGQTGTGKTHTAFGLLQLLAPAVLEIGSVEVSVFEISGSAKAEVVLDLLADGDTRPRIALREDAEGTVHARGTQVACSAASQLEELLDLARSRRLTESTERNLQSSRSHCVVALRVGDGLLRVVDLAGSERNFETVAHTRAMAQRGALINASLLHLKDCLRVRHQNLTAEKAAHVPYRRSKLVHYLRTCFTDPKHRTVVLGTLSGAPMDVDHSRNTLMHITLMRAPDLTLTVGAHKSRLHSNLQDARAKMLQEHHSFNMVTAVGGSILKKYDPAAAKTEAFVDPRYHKELLINVDRDEWEVNSAAAEVVHLLTSRELLLQDQWRNMEALRVQSWNAAEVRQWAEKIAGEPVSGLPSQLTGSQIARLGPLRLNNLCGPEVGAKLWEALQQLQQESAARKLATCDRNARTFHLGQGKDRGNVRKQKVVEAQDDSKETTAAEAPGDLKENTAPLSPNVEGKDSVLQPAVQPSVQQDLAEHAS